jgi:hypothetical protein
LILNTDEGTVTEFCQVGSHITVPYEEYEALPEVEKWMAHRTTPIKKFFENWTKKYEKLVWMLVPNPIGRPVTGRFYNRAVSSPEEEILVRQEQLESLHVQDDDSSGHDDREDSELDREQRRERQRERKQAEGEEACSGRFGRSAQFRRGYES